MALSPLHRWCLRRGDQSQQDGDEILGQLCSERVSWWHRRSRVGKGQGVSAGWEELQRVLGKLPALWPLTLELPQWTGCPGDGQPPVSGGV